MTKEKKVYDYELIPFGHDFADAMPRKYRMFRFTEEAGEMNKQYIYNNTKKRLVRVSGRFNNGE